MKVKLSIWPDLVVDISEYEAADLTLQGFVVTPVEYKNKEINPSGSVNNSGDQTQDKE